MVADEVAKLSAGYRVLEVGCGTGYVLRMLHHLCVDGTVVGMDLFHEGLSLAKRRSRAGLVQARIEAPPFAEPFDLVGIFDTLEHVPDDRAVLDHLRQLLRPKAALLITVPAYQSLWSGFDEEAHHCRRYEPAMLRARLAAAGFVVDYLTPFMSLLYPVARVGRWASDARRGRRAAAGLPAESAFRAQLAIRPGLNGLLAFLLAQESRLVARRRQLPIGTSLLALARVP